MWAQLNMNFLICTIVSLWSSLVLLFDKPQDLPSMWHKNNSTSKGWFSQEPSVSLLGNSLTNESELKAWKCHNLVYLNRKSGYSVTPGVVVKFPRISVLVLTVIICKPLLRLTVQIQDENKSVKFLHHHQHIKRRPSSSRNLSSQFPVVPLGAKANRWRH